MTTIFSEPFENKSEILCPFISKYFSIYFLTIRIQPQYNVQNQEFNLDIIVFFFFAMPSSIWDRNSPTRNGTGPRCFGSTES